MDARYIRTVESGGGGYVGDLLSEVSANPVSVYLADRKIQLRDGGQVINHFLYDQALQAPVQRSVDQPVSYYENLVGSVTAPA